MMRLLGRPDSLNVRKVLWALEELGMPYSRENVGGLFGGNDAAEYRALNPNGLIPTLVHDQNVVWESNAIIRYLAELSGPSGFGGRDALARAHIGQWMDWQLSVANAATQPLFQQLVRLPPDRRDPGAIARHTQEAVAAMSLLDRALPGDGLLLGSDLTAADIAVGVTLHRYMSLDIARPYLASLARYYHGLASRPAFATFVAIGKP